MQQLLRATVLDALQHLLDDRDWSRITLADVATRVGISRQTLYNEFGSRTGLAQAYAIRLSDAFVDHVEAAIEANKDDVGSALENGISSFLIDAAGNPLIRSMMTGEPNNELLRLVTANSEPILVHATERLDRVFQDSWVHPPEPASALLARMAVRLALSYIAMPPEPAANVPADFRALLTPFVESFLEEKSSPTAPQGPRSR